MNQKGITMIALIVTIIVLLILAGISISAVLGENGILNQANNSKEQTEIKAEKDLIQASVVLAQGKNSQNIVKFDELEKAVNIKVGNGKTTMTYYSDDEMSIVFNDSKREYIVDLDGNTELYIQYEYINEDKEIGDLKQDTDGRYLIECIEDLVVVSIKSRGDYTLTNGTTLKGTSFDNIELVLTRDLDFKSVKSYKSPDTKIFNSFLGINDEDVTLKEALTNENYEGFKPIAQMNGVFNGANKTLKNLYIYSDSADIGLFSRMGGTLKDLTLTGNIKTKDIINENTGGFVALSHGRIERCVNKTNIVSNNNYVGGIAGGNRGIISECTNEGKIEGRYRAGGILGSDFPGNECKVENSINKGIIQGSLAGGIIGRLYSDSEIINCSNTGYVKGESAGGIAAIKFSSGALINRSMNSGKIEGEVNAGGIIGNHDFIGGTATISRITNSYNVGEIVSNGNAGGIIGQRYNYGVTECLNCYNIGNLKGNESTGGIIGKVIWDQDLTINNCYNLSDTRGSSIYGGIIGKIERIQYSSIKIKKSYYLDSINKVIGTDGSSDTVEDLKKSKENIQSQEFVDLLNSNANEIQASEGYNSGVLLKWNLGKDNNPGFE